MALISGPKASAASRDAIVLDLGDIARQGARLRAKASEEADAILAEARAERQRLIDGAAAEGRAAGLEQGLEEGRKTGREEGRRAALEEVAPRLRALDEAWTAALDALAREREAMIDGARRELIGLALEIARRVIRRTIEVTPDAALPQVEAALERVSRDARVTLAVHPDDAGLVRDALPGIAARVGTDAAAELLEDPALSRGSCVARTARGGEVDASIEAQIERIASALLPGTT